MIDRATRPRIECWMRDSAPPGTRECLDRVCARLHDLVERGPIVSVEFNVWGKRVRCPSDPESAGDEPDQIDGDVWATYEAFDEWAASNGYTLSPAFRRFEQTSLVSREPCEVVEFPLVCLAVYDGEELTAVVPCSTEQRTWTVEECLDRLGHAGNRSTPSESEGGVHG